MAYRISGSIIIDNNGSIRNVGVATIGLVDGKVSAKAITEQTDGGSGDVTGADEILLYDQQTGELLRVTVDEFVVGSGIGTLVSDFDNLSVTGISTISGVQINSGIVTASGAGIVTYYGDGSNLTGVGGNVASLDDIGDVNVASAGVGSILAYDGANWIAQAAVGLGSTGATGATGPTGAQGAGALTVIYRFSATTTMADPGAGLVRVDNASQNSATAVAISTETDSGALVNTLLNLATTGAQIRLQDNVDSTIFKIYNVDSDPVDNGTWFEWQNVTFLSGSTTDIANTRKIQVSIQQPTLPGATGPQGATGIGSTGATGATGPQGATGVGLSPGSDVDLAHVEADTLNVSGLSTFVGQVNVNGNIALGDSPSDLVNFNSEVVGNLVSFIDNSADLGSATKGWRNLYLETELVGNNSTNITGINSVTAANFYGDGSNLTGVGLGTTGFYEVGGIQAGVATITTIESDLTINGTLDVTGNATFEGNTQFGNFLTDSVNFVAKVVGDIEPLVNNASDLGAPGKAWGKIYVGTELDGEGTANIIGINSVTAAEYYGDGSNLIGVGGNVANLDDIGDVSVAGVASGQALVYDGGTSEWVPGIAPAFQIDNNNNVYVPDLIGTPQFTTGSGNFVFGIDAGDALDTGSDNVAIGAYSLSNTTTGNNNVALGKYSMQTAAISAASNTALGFGAARATTANSSVFAGFCAGAVSSSNFSAFIGYLAGETTNITQSVAIGLWAGRNTQAGSVDAGGNNTFIGVSAACAATSSNSIVIGNSAGRVGVMTFTTAIGPSALRDSTANDCRSIYIGTNAARCISGITQDNIFFGRGVGQSTSGAQGSIMMGTYAGQYSGGVSKIAIGNYASRNSTSNFTIAIGDQAARFSSAGNDIAIGRFANYGGSGACNTSLGYSANFCNNGSGNVTIGYYAAGNNTLVTNSSNVFIGSYAASKLNNSQISNTNVVIGDRAGSCYAAMCSNVIIGQNAGGNNAALSGCQILGNVFVGQDAGLSQSGDCNLLLGTNVVSAASTTGSCQLAIGMDTNRWITGDSNFDVTIPNDLTVTGTLNATLGSIDQHSDVDTTTAPPSDGDALVWDNTGGNWVPGVGPSFELDSQNNVYAPELTTLGSLTTGTYNLLIGQNAGNPITTGCRNTVFGMNAGCSLSTGNENVYIGDYAGSSSSTGFSNVMIGHAAGQYWNGGNGSVYVGNQAGRRVTDGDRNVAIGAGALEGDPACASTVNAENVAIGPFAMYKATTGSSINVAIGRFAGAYIKGSCDNIALGRYALCGNNTVGSSGGCNVSIGYQSMRNATSGASNLAIGAYAGRTLTTGNSNVLIGTNTGEELTTETDNVAIGCAAYRCSTGTQNVAIGKYAARCVSGSSNVSIGRYSLPSAANGVVTANNMISIGNQSGMCYTTGDGSVLIGLNAGCAAVGNVGHLIAVGAGSGRRTTGLDNVAVGHYALFGNSVDPTSGQRNVAMGFQTLASLTSGSRNIAIGQQSSFAMTTANDSISMGCYSMFATTTGSSNIALGRSSLRNSTSGFENIALGHLTGQCITTGSNNVFIGTYNVSGASSVPITGSRNVVIGTNLQLNGAGINRAILIGSTMQTAATGATLEIGNDANRWIQGDSNYNVTIPKDLTVGGSNIRTYTVSGSQGAGSATLASMSLAGFWRMEITTSIRRSGAGALLDKTVLTYNGTSISAAKFDGTAVSTNTAITATDVNTSPFAINFSTSGASLSIVLTRPGGGAADPYVASIVVNEYTMPA